METIARGPSALHISKANPHSRILLSAFLTPSATITCSRRRRSGRNARQPGVHQRRNAHSRRHVSSVALDQAQDSSPLDPAPATPRGSPLACLPLSTLIRSYIITSVSSYPVLLRPSLAALAFLAYSKSPVFNPDRNPLLHFLLKKTFYAQFCAGEKPAEIRKTVEGLKTMGYQGVILGYAKEVVLEGNDVSTLDNSADCAAQDQCNKEDIKAWEKGTMDTVELSNEGDFVALKFTGAGRQALQHLSKTIACAPELEAAVHKICRRSQERGVRLLFDAEQASLQEGIDNWTMYFMKKYNKGEKALVYGTYQAYAKKTPDVLARHLEQARREGYVLGVKLVRGAYMGSDPRELFWPRIEDTHACYDGITEALLRRKYNDVLKPAEGSSGEFPQVDYVMASHNAQSVEYARQIRDEQAQTGAERIDMAYGQLMGMADNVSCELVQVAKARARVAEREEIDVPRAYKYLVWGSVAECSKYLLRRAQENRDAVTRTVEARQALGREVARRLGLVR